MIPLVSILHNTRLSAHVLVILKYPPLACIKTLLQLAFMVPLIIAALKEFPKTSLTHKNNEYKVVDSVYEEVVISDI